MDPREEFRRLHQDGFFVLPNAWDVGSAVRLAAMGFPAVATTSSGHAASLGRRDQQVTFDELCAHVAAIVPSVPVPVSADSEALFAETPAGIEANVRLLAELGVAGCSIEDYDPARGAIMPVDEACERVAAAATAARSAGVVLTARAENHLYGGADLDDTVGRLRAYHDAGAEVVYAPGLVAAGDIARVVAETHAPVNVLLVPGGPGPAELAALGVRRASTGGRLASVAYDAAMALAEGLRTQG